MTLPISRHRILNLLADAVLILVAWRLTFWIRFDPKIPAFYKHLLDWQVCLLVVGIQLAVFVVFGFYNRWWRYISTRDMWGAARGVVVASLLVALVLYAFPPTHTARLPRGIALIDMLLLLAFVAGSRLLARTLIERPAPGGFMARGREVVIVGAGDAGQLILRELQRSPQLGYTPIGLLDDDPRKKNLRVHGVRVLGPTSELRRVLRDGEPDEVLIAMPSASGELRQRIVDIAQEERVPVKTLPGLNELISGDVNLAGQLRPVQVEDVLGREPVEVDLDEVAGYIAGKTVLVTGAGGSIGAELCRQIARVGAGRIILVDHSEPALFDIERELVGERGYPAALPVLADVGNRTKMRQVFEKFRPDVVFHAAAYKHVPLLEANPLEAVRNNVLATRTLADVAVEFETKRFVLVSTDKAAQPKNLLGQSKSIGEWIVQAYGSRDDVSTRFVAVRFGNVLGSSGSVIPIFRRQIERGGPVTVTHKDMTRYFMTIPEAVSLIVQAGAIGEQAHVYVLDMGEPVSIYELAENMIRLSGKVPERDVAIRVTGVRAGEKLHEVLWNDGEAAEPTAHPKILAASQEPIDPSWLDGELRELERLVDDGETLELVARMNAMARAPQRVDSTRTSSTI
ncbi:MAG: polysaccharide biosynthesis protein [Gaiellaceae bacterium]|jgi:FlaA1/EpsC-like NDP-sugar epimerase